MTRAVGAASTFCRHSVFSKTFFGACGARPLNKSVRVLFIQWRAAGAKQLFETSQNIVPPKLLVILAHVSCDILYYFTFWYAVIYAMASPFFQKKIARCRRRFHFL